MLYFFKYILYCYCPIEHLARCLDVNNNLQSSSSFLRRHEANIDGINVEDNYSSLQKRFELVVSKNSSRKKRRGQICKDQTFTVPKPIPKLKQAWLSHSHSPDGSGTGAPTLTRAGAGAGAGAGASSGCSSPALSAACRRRSS